MKKKLSTPFPQHTGVLKRELLQVLSPCRGDICIDATFGAGDHSREILKLTGESGLVVGIDRDEQAIAAARQKFRSHKNLILLRAEFSRLPVIASDLGISGKINCIFADLGFSSTQMFDPTRGFSIYRDGPLDMRMSHAEQRLTAGDLVNQKSVAELTKLFREYGEDPHAATIAAHIVQTRDRQPITSTTQLAELVAAKIGMRRSRIHPATRIFQALRIAVNAELDELRGLLVPATCDLLRKNGRLAIISFHSLEDRIVKNKCREFAGQQKDLLPRSLPVTVYSGKDGKVRIIKPFPIQPSPQEIYNNKKARSAKLRVVQRI